MKVFWAYSPRELAFINEKDYMQDSKYKVQPEQTKRFIEFFNRDWITLVPKRIIVMLCHERTPEELQQIISMQSPKLVKVEATGGRYNYVKFIFSPLPYFSDVGEPVGIP